MKKFSKKIKIIVSKNMVLQIKLNMRSINNKNINKNNSKKKTILKFKMASIIKKNNNSLFNKIKKVWTIQELPLMNKKSKYKFWK